MTLSIQIYYHKIVNLINQLTKLNDNLFVDSNNNNLSFNGIVISFSH